MNTRVVFYGMLFFIIGFGACIDTDRPDTGVRLGEPFKLAFDQSRVLEDGTVVSFLELLKDSRCPDDALCTWEGEAIIAVILQEDEETASLVELKIPGYIDRYSVEGHIPEEGPRYTVTLIQLDPYPVVDHAQPKIAYVATLVISRNNGESREDRPSQSAPHR